MLSSRSAHTVPVVCL